MHKIPNLCYNANMAKEKQLNVRIPPDLHRQAKIEATKEGKSLAAIIVDLLIRWLTGKQEADK